MSFPRYSTYKDSGVDWLGELPAHWQTSKLGFVAWIRARLGWKGLKAEEYVNDGFAFLSTPNIKGNCIDFQNINFISRERYEESPEIMLRKGDVLLAKDGSTLGTVNVVRDLPRPATVNGSLAVITPRECLDSVYLGYVLASEYMQQTIQRAKGGMGVPHLFQSDLNKFWIPLPPLDEQVAMGTFLDGEIAKIDALIAEQERLIALLNEKRTAVVSHAVTGGLNPAARSRLSGVAWLGAMPAHWTIRRVKHLVRSVEQGWSPQCDGFPVDGDQDWGVLKVGCVNGGTFRPSENKRLPPELEPVPELSLCRADLLISRANTRELVGGAAVVDRDYPRLMLCDKLYRLRVRTEVLPDFLALYLNSSRVRGQIELSATGASDSMLNITQSAILELPVALPSIDEQAVILAAVTSARDRLDALAREARHAIELLEERRSALISAAVIGQIDVRDVLTKSAA